MVKKIIIGLMAVLFSVSFSGCGTGNVVGTADGQLVTEEQAQAQKEEEESEAAKQEVQAGDYEATLDGLTEYLTAKGILDANATKSDMQSAFIGAKNGYKYVYGFNGNNNVSVELYEYDLDALDETAQQTINSVKETGKFTIMNIEVEAYLSHNDQFLMIYTDTADEDDQNSHANKKAEAIELFQNFPEV